MSAAAPKKDDRPAMDPLYVIFEQHLFSFQDPETDRRSFISKVVTEYLSYLRRLNISVPRSLEQPIVDELSEQVNAMLVKKIYGCLSIEEFRKGATSTDRKKARNRYGKLSLRQAR
jgi:hypothetical protein